MEKISLFYWHKKAEHMKMETGNATFFKNLFEIQLIEIDLDKLIKATRSDEWCLINRLLGPIKKSDSCKHE
jgi:hypothetical protein